MADPFIDRQDLTDYLGIDVTTDPGALIVVDAACDICRTGARGQQFNRGTTTVTLDGQGTDALLLPQLPVNTVGTVTVAGGTVTDWALKDNGILVRKLDDPSDWDGDVPATEIKWPSGRQNVVVTYDHGYTDADMPRDVKMVALAVATRLAVQGAAKQEKVGDNTITYSAASTDLTDGEKAILRKHAR